MLSPGPKLAIRLTTPDGYTIPITIYCIDPEISTGPGGYQQFTTALRLRKYLAFIVYNQAMGGEIDVSWGGRSVWTGRIEDVTLSQAGVELVALGAWRALEDLPMTMVLSETSYSAWRALSQADNVNANPGRSYIDTNNRIYIAPNKNAALSVTNWGGVGYIRPDKSITRIYRVTFDYSFLAPSGSLYRGDLRQRNVDWSNIAPSLWEVQGTGSLQTGSEDISISGGAANLSFMCWYASETPLVFTGETGDFYLKITNLRLYGLDQTTITAKDVLTQIVSYVNSVNPGQLSAETGQIGDPGLDLTDQVYEDTRPIDIVKSLETLGDDQDPPRYWRASITDGKRLQFRPIGEGARDFEVNFGDLQITRSVDSAYTGYYATYKDRNGRTLRTDEGANAYAKERLGFSRIGEVGINTTSAAQAAAARDAATEDARYNLPFSSFSVNKIYSSLQMAVPIYLPKPGDYVTIRNWPPILGDAQDRVRKFRILETAVNLRSGVLTITPENYPRSLDQMLSRRGEGIF